MIWRRRLTSQNRMHDGSVNPIASSSFSSSSSSIPFFASISRVPLCGPAVPESRDNQHHRARAGKQNQECLRQIKPRTDGSPRRQPAAEKAIKRAGPEILHALLQDQLHGAMVPRQRRLAFRRAHHSRRRWRQYAIPANRPSAIGTDGHRVGAMFEAFHRLRRFLSGFASATGIYWRK